MDSSAITDYVVIGASYGDEGKGRTVDWLVKNTGAEYVVRPNGAGQATHTVSNENGDFVFGSLGAGTLSGATTVIGRYAYVNPWFLVPEYQSYVNPELDVSAPWPPGTPAIVSHESRPLPKVQIDFRACVALYEDIALNQVRELSRGEARHGSCGHGLNEAVQRSKTHPIRWQDVLAGKFDSLYNSVRETYLPTVLTPELLEVAKRHNIDWVFNDPDIREVYNMRLRRMQELVQKPTFYGVLWERLHPYAGVSAAKFRPLIHEMSQGLALDQRSSDFPHVTNSNTGLDNVVAGYRRAVNTVLCAVYCTRIYSTRHGAGPLPYEDVPVDNIRLYDNTNAAGEWQGAIRYAPLDLDGVLARVNADFCKSYSLLQPAKRVLSLSHLDCVVDESAPIPVVFQGRLQKMLVSDLVTEAERHFDGVLLSHGSGTHQTKWSK